MKAHIDVRDRVRSAGAWAKVTIVALVIAVPACNRNTRDGYTPSYPGAELVDVTQIQFDDGESFKLGDEFIRVLGIDTPETRSPSVGIYEDQKRGPEAAESTEVWVLRARKVEIVRDGRGAYGRRLAHIFVDGDLLGIRHIEIGLAYENVSHFGDNGFPELADLILDAAASGPKPDFEQPYKWRRKNQKRK